MGLVQRKRERRSAIANKTGRLFPVTGLLLSRDRPRGSGSRVGSSPSQSSGAHGVGGDPPLRLRWPLDQQGCLLVRRSVEGLGPTTHLLSSSVPTEVIDRSSLAPMLFLGGLDWLGHAMSGDLDLTPRDCWFGTGIASPPARLARLWN